MVIGDQESFVMEYCPFVRFVHAAATTAPHAGVGAGVEEIVLVEVTQALNFGLLELEVHVGWYGGGSDVHVVQLLLQFDFLIFLLGYFLSVAFVAPHHQLQLLLLYLLLQLIEFSEVGQVVFVVSDHADLVDGSESSKKAMEVFFVDILFGQSLDLDCKFFRFHVFAIFLLLADRSEEVDLPDKVEQKQGHIAYKGEQPNDVAIVAIGNDRPRIVP